MNIQISDTRHGYQVIRKAEKLKNSPGYDLNGEEINKKDLIGFKIKDIYDDGNIFFILEKEEIRSATKIQD